MLKSIEKIGTVKFPGSSLDKGKVYGDLPWYDIPSHRKGTQKRIDLLKEYYDFKGKSGIDLGCNAGHITFRLQMEGAEMTGVDYDINAVSLANEIEKDQNTGARFIVSKIDYDLLLNIKKDFAIWFDSWMWVAKDKGEYEARKYILILSQNVNTLFFSTAEGDGMAKGSSTIQTANDVYNMLKKDTIYKNVKCIGKVKDGWHARSIFKCWN